MMMMMMKQKHRLEGNAIPARQSHAHMLLYVSGVNYNLISNYTMYMAQLCGRFFLRFGKFPPQICESCGATYRYNYETPHFRNYSRDIGMIMISQIIALSELYDLPQILHGDRARRDH